MRRSRKLDDIDYLESTRRRQDSAYDVPVELMSSDRNRLRNRPVGVSSKAISSSGGFKEFY